MYVNDASGLVLTETVEFSRMLETRMLEKATEKQSELTSSTAAAAAASAGGGGSSSGAAASSSAVDGEGGEKAEVRAARALCYSVGVDVRCLVERECIHCCVFDGGDGVWVWWL